MDQRSDIFCGLDVGKSEHHATALNAAGERVVDQPLPRDEARLRELFTRLQEHGRGLVMVEQPNTIGALPAAVARDCGCGCEVAYLPGLAMRKPAGLYPGTSGTDARDAFSIADTARAMPHTLRAVDRDSGVLSTLKVLSGFDADLTHECTRAINRLRSLLLQIFPVLERVFPGTVRTRSLVLDLLIRYAGPTGLRAAGRGNVLRRARNHSRKDPGALIDAVFTGLGGQSVTVAGTRAVELVIPRGAAGSRNSNLRWRRPGHAAVRDVHPGEFPALSGNKELRRHSSGPPGSPPATTPRPRPATTGNEPKGRNTTPPSSAWHAAAATSSTRCSAMAHSTRK